MYAAAVSTTNKDGLHAIYSRLNIPNIQVLMLIYLPRAFN